VVGGGQIGGGAVQEMMCDQWTCMQRRWSSWWRRHRRDELRPRSAMATATARPGPEAERGEI
jgi:hypothetical protein